MAGIVNAQGEDITSIMLAAISTAKIPLHLALGCAIAESGLNPFSERWGRFTDQAKAAIRSQDWTTLQQIINQVLAVSPDISFGYGQQIVRYHALGDHTESIENCLYVRAETFADPAGNLVDMAKRLASDLKVAMTKDLAPVDGDPFLGACAIYNHGHWPEGLDAAKVALEWKGLKPNLDNYRKGLSDAAAILANGPGPVPDPKPAPPEGGNLMTIEEKAQWMTENGDRLGNNGQPYSPVCEWDTPAGPMRFQQFWLGSMLEYPTLDGNRDVATAPEGTLDAAQLAHFKAAPREPVELPTTPVAPPAASVPVIWVGSPHHFSGRQGQTPIALVIHTMGGSLAGTDSWFNNPTSQVSAHYGIGLQGDIHQYVQLTDGAWANGVLEPGNTWMGPAGVNPNLLTVGIETEDLGNGDQPVTEEEYLSTAQMGRVALAQYPSIRYLITHTVISPQTRPNCCGARWVASGKFNRLATVWLEARTR